MSNHCSGASSLNYIGDITRATSPAEDSMAALNDANIELADAVATLHGRLGPVLMSLPVGPESDQTMAAGCSPLVTELRERTEQVRAVTHRVKAITERLSI